VEVRNFETDLQIPAVDGTKNVLRSCFKHPSVKKVVLVSSVAAVYCPPVTAEKINFTEDDWENKATETHMPYFLSKRLAEQAAWQLVKEENSKNPGRNISLVSVNPSLVFGPLLYKPTNLNTSNSLVLGLLFGGDSGASGYVDIDDVVETLYRAMTFPNASGRYLCSGSSSSFSELTAILAEMYPELVMAVEGGDTTAELVPKFSTEKVQKELGIKFTPLRDTLKKTMNSLKEKEFVPTF